MTAQPKIFRQSIEIEGTATLGAEPTTSNHAATKNYVDNNSGLSWLEITAASQALDVNKGYLANRATRIDFTLPGTAAVGKVIRIAGMGVGGWRIIQGSGQQIHFGNSSSTSGATGYVEFTHQRDSVELLCIEANTTWQVISSVGNLELV